MTPRGKRESQTATSATNTPANAEEQEPVMSASSFEMVTPHTDQVRGDYVERDGGQFYKDLRERRRAAFDRWYTAETNAIKAEALRCAARELRSGLLLASSASVYELLEALDNRAKRIEERAK